MNPTELVGMLNVIVNGFDALTDKYHLEKIKTIGKFLFYLYHNNNLFMCELNSFMKSTYIYQ